MYTKLFENVFKSGDDSFFQGADADQRTKEETYLKRFDYEYFVEKLGPAPFRGFGSSIKKGRYIDTGLDGIAYRIYGCGIFKRSTDEIEKFEPIVVPLESTIVLPD